MNHSRRPSLEKVLPEGLLVNRDWLYAKGFKRSAIDYYLRSEILVAAARGIYRRQGPPLKWQHVAYSLQVLDYGLHVGGRTALEVQGLRTSCRYGEYREYGYMERAGCQPG